MKAIICPFCGSEHITWEKNVFLDKNTLEIAKIKYTIYCEKCARFIHPTEEMKKHINNIKMR